MGWIEDKAAQADQIYRTMMVPHLAPNEPLIGVFQATQSKAFSNRLFIIGVMPQRIVMIEVDRKLTPKNAPIVISANDIVKSSVDGFGGGLAHFLTTDLGDIRFDTATEKYKLAVLGGGLDQLFTGEGQLQGKTAFLQFLAAARGIV